MMDNCMENFGRHLDLSNRDDIVEYIIPKMIKFLTNLDVIWDEIGLTTDDRKQKGMSVIEHVKGLFRDMLQEAKDLKSNLAHSNKSLQEELLAIAKELRIDISDDIKGYECMPLNAVHNDLKDKIAKYRDKYVTLYNEADELNATEKNLCRDLGKTEKYLCTSPLPTKDEIINFKTYINNLSAEKIKREENFQTMKSEIIEMMKDIGVEPTLSFEKNVLKDNDFLVTDENMKLLTKWHSALKDQQSDLHSRISDLREKINVYWERLEESPKKRSEFSIKYAGNNINTYEALKVEESKCRDEIKANFKIFIDKMRQEILKWWKQCYFGDEEKKEFIHFESVLYTEDLLTLHERYIEKLKNHFETNKNIYDLISKRTELWDRLQELEERAINPDRLKNRGGQLLREEKERNSVKARLPKVEQQLLKLVADYEAKYNTPFVIFGQRVSEIIECDWEQFKENRHTQISAKKQARENVKTSAPSTPKTPKRKLAIPLFGSASAKKNKSTSKKTVPKIQVTASTINKRVSLERRKRMERKKRSVGPKNESKTISTTDYDHFELGLEDKATCRSTIQNNNNNAGPSCTSILVRTPSRSNLRAKSPANAANKLTPKNLPIIF